MAFFCRACRTSIGNIPARKRWKMNAKVLADLRSKTGFAPDEYCRDCFLEKATGRIPKGMCDSHLPPPHAGLVARQRSKLGKTGGG